MSDPTEIAVTFPCFTIVANPATGHQGHCPRPAKFVVIPPNGEGILHACARHTAMFLMEIAALGMPRPIVKMLWIPAEVNRGT